ncbi:MAG: hypothetical protein NDJ89_15595 [Oligoflexia bacterium]|nr:hypothetical protein [Oligoflexia bacterium]
MAEIKGKFILLARDYLGSPFEELRGIDPEEWYDTDLFEASLRSLARASRAGRQRIVELGREVYPTIRRTVGLPARLSSPLDFIRYEADGFVSNHRGFGVVPRRFLQAEQGRVLVEATAPRYNPALFEGVFLGLLEMAGVTGGQVLQTRARARGHRSDEFLITWPVR